MFTTVLLLRDQTGPNLVPFWAKTGPMSTQSQASQRLSRFFERTGLPLPRRLPKLDLVPLRIDHPSELPLVRIRRLLEPLAAFLAQRRQQRVEVVHAVVDHEGRSTGGKLLAAGGADRPDGHALGRV